MTHGLSDTRLYGIYSGMKQRCYNPNNQHYKWYGEKGITICDEWLNKNGLQNFISWSLNNGYNEDLTIDRIDSNRGYSPDNCRWITLKENAMKQDYKLIEKSKNLDKVDTSSKSIESHFASPMAEKIKIVLLKRKTTIKTLSERLGCSSQNISNKFKRNDFKEKELQQIADVLNVKFHGTFEIPETGEII